MAFVKTGLGQSMGVVKPPQEVKAAPQPKPQPKPTTQQPAQR
jgi:hypothetical protein